MEIKKSPSMNVLSYELVTKMATLKEDVGYKNVELFKEAIELGLHPTGPQYWAYQWVSIDPEAEFKLKLLIPVTSFGKPVKPKEFNFEKINGMQYVSIMHYGAWDNMKDSYQQLMTQINDNNLKPGSNSREVYINCDFEQPENNITEIQFEVL